MFAYHAVAAVVHTDYASIWANVDIVHAHIVVSEGAGKREPAFQSKGKLFLPCGCGVGTDSLCLT